MTGKPDKGKGAPAGASEAVPEGTPEWLRAAIEWKPPHPVSRRGRKLGSRSTIKRAAGDQIEVVNNARRDMALELLCRAMAMGEIATKSDVDRKIRDIAKSAGVTTKTLRSDLSKQLAALPPWAGFKGTINPNTLRAVKQWKDGAEDRAKRKAAEDEFFAAIKSMGGN